MCVCQRSEPVEVSYKRAPSAVPANRKLPCILTVSHGSVCFFCSCMLFFPSPLKIKQKAPCLSSRLHTLCTNVTTTIHPISLLTAHLLLLPYSLLLVPGWASLLDQTGGGVVLLWCSGSSWRSPVYGCLFIQPPR